MGSKETGMSVLDSVTDGAERTDQGQGSLWQETARRQKETGMTCLDYLVYDPERLARRFPPQFKLREKRRSVSGTSFFSAHTAARRENPQASR